VVPEQFSGFPGRSRIFSACGAFVARKSSETRGKPENAQENHVRKPFAVGGYPPNEVCGQSHRGLQGHVRETPKSGYAPTPRKYAAWPVNKILATISQQIER